MLVFLNVIEDKIVRGHLEEIYYQYRKEMFYTAYKILKDYHEAEDVVQTALIKLADYLDDELGVKCNKTKGLVVIIVRNLSINIYKQRKKRVSVNIEDLADVVQDEKNISPELNVLRLDQSREMAERLSEINTGYADILTLKYTFQYSDNEIAAMLNISEGNVRTRLSRAKKALESVIGGANYEWA